MSLDEAPINAHLRRSGPLAPGRAVRLVRSALAQLAPLHDAGRGHGDLAPSTLSLDELRVLPARSPEERARVVTRAFVAPELRRAPLLASPGGDVYALSGLLFLLVTGQPPTDLHLATAASPRWGALPPALAPVVRAGLSLDPDERPSPRELDEALERVAPGLADDLGPEPPVLRTELVPGSPAPVGAELPAGPRVDAASLVAAVRSKPAEVPRATTPGRGLLWVAVALVLGVSAVGAALGPLGDRWGAPAVAAPELPDGRYVGHLEGAEPVELAIAGAVGWLGSEPPGRPPARLTSRANDPLRLEGTGVVVALEPSGLPRAYRIVLTRPDQPPRTGVIVWAGTSAPSPPP